MSGTVRGGMKAGATNRMRYGDDFYRIIGIAGGAKSRGGGFASRKRGPDGLTGRQRARVAGQIGGRASRRRPQSAYQQ